ncbi:CoA transferase [Paraburkholderia fungorum]|uniref:CoA transferase n=1 Tax=Paraburkholderia fungorum TaxID=134537 RepID=UPI0038BCED25
MYSFRQNHPDKIYCLITGYGTKGPYAGHPTYDSVVQAATGMTGLTLARDGVPSYVPMLICDHVVGEIAAGSILAAIMQQRATGNGSTIEVPMFETMSAFVLQEHLAQQSFDPPVGPPGDLRLLSPHNKPVKTADGWIAFTINTDQQVRAFLKAVGREELLDDARFTTVAGRAKNVAEWFAQDCGDPVDHQLRRYLPSASLVLAATRLGNPRCSRRDWLLIKRDRGPARGRRSRRKRRAAKPARMREERVE